MHSIIFCPWGGQFLLSCPLIGCDSELFSSLQFSCSVVSDSLQPQGLLQARLHCPSPTPGLTQTHVHWVGDAIQSSYPLLSPSPPAFNFPSIRVFSNESVPHIRCHFSFNIRPSNEYSGLISFRMDWLDFLAVQGTLKSLLQHHSSKASNFSTQLSLQSNFNIHTWLLEKTIALIGWTFVGKVMSLLLNMLSRLVITFLPRSKCLLISWLQSPSAMILEPQKIKSVTVFPSICHEVMGPDAMILVFWMLSFKPSFSLSSFNSSRGSLVLLHFLP